MTVKHTYPGVYVEEIPSDVRTIAGASTSTTVFIGWAARGPVDRARHVLGFEDFVQCFGGLDGRSQLGYALKHFFDNGGADAYVVRLVADNATTAAVTIDGMLRVEAHSPGAWANEYAVETRTRVDDPARFRFAIWRQPLGGQAAVVESFDNLSVLSNDSSAVDAVINDKSAIVKIARIGNPVSPPADTPVNAPRSLIGGLDGDVLVPDSAAFGCQFPSGGVGGIFDRIDALDGFNLLVVPGETTLAVVATLQAYCRKRRAFCILDSAETATADDIHLQPDTAITGPDAMNSALYFPWMTAEDPLQAGQTRSFPPSGFVAGVYARTDRARGVWRAPAGLEADLKGATGVAVQLDDRRNEDLNLRGINCIRRFPSGIVVWGSRTLHGDNRLASEWKYVPVRRLALYIEESIYRGTKWVVFEPNSEPVWAQIRLNVGTFMNNLFRQGAFQGASPRDAWFVKCDSDTVTQNDIDSGTVNIVVGFAPLKPAEFVIIRIRQAAVEKGV
ncbi:MAG: phage tail sheath subtilisin-like domain-containing protein [Desulfobacterales bacterium]